MSEPRRYAKGGIIPPYPGDHADQVRINRDGVNYRLTPAHARQLFDRLDAPPSRRRHNRWGIFWLLMLTWNAVMLGLDVGRDRPALALLAAFGTLWCGVLAYRRLRDL